MGDNNNTVPNLSHLVSSGDSLSSQGKQQTKAQSASEHDVVDTFWDIPLITFSEVESAVERGEASDAAYAQAAATSMTAATSSTPVSDAPTVNLRVEDFPNSAGKHISGADNDSTPSLEPDSMSSSTATLDATQSADASPSAESAERTVSFASPVESAFLWIPLCRFLWILLPLLLLPSYLKACPCQMTCLTWKTMSMIH